LTTCTRIPVVRDSRAAGGSMAVLFGGVLSVGRRCGERCADKCDWVVRRWLTLLVPDAIQRLVRANI
jgi:hypothetical protein